MTYNKIYEQSFGLHRYGWKYVISNFLKQSYFENDEFYLKHPEFEWVEYAKEFDLNNHNSCKEHYLKNIQYKSKINYKKMKYIIFDEWLERKYLSIRKNDNEYLNNFISFVHSPPLYDIPDYLYEVFQRKDLKIILEKNEKLLKEKKNLKILICLSDYHRKYIKQNIDLNENTIMKTLYHPLELSNTKYRFNITKYIENENKSLYCIGWWLRKYDIFLKLSCNKTIIIKTNEGKHVNKYITNELRRIIRDKNDDTINNDLIENKNKSEKIEYDEITNEEIQKLNIVYNTEICDFIENEDYDKIFYNNIVFLDLYSCVANNILLECIMNNTPILICYNKSVIEYLGNDYPFYFINYEDAEKKSKDLESIIKTHYYLKNMDKTKFTYNYFNNELNQIIMENI